MSKSHSIVTGPAKLTITDNNTGGTLVIRHNQSDDYLEHLSEDDLNPIIELANDLEEAFEKDTLALVLVGCENFMTFDDDDFVIMEGGIQLQDVSISNPYLRNVKLSNVDISCSPDLMITESELTDMELNLEEEIVIRCCYVDKDVQLPWIQGESYLFRANQLMQIPK
jgi:hypothetical protein